MDWGLESAVVQGTLVVTTVFGILYSFITWQYGYWREKGIPSVEPSFPFGNARDLVLSRIDIGQFYERFYKKFKGVNYGGIHELRRPALILTDLNMIKQVLTKDFIHFTDRALPPKSPHDTLAHHLFAMDGQEWKDMRTKLTPTYSSGRMKLMYILIEKCSEQLKVHLDDLVKQDNTIDVKELMSKFTIDIIASCAFGLEVNTLEDSNNEFYEISKLIFKQSKTLMMKRFFMSSFPRLSSFLRLRLSDKNVEHFLTTLVETTVKYREEHNISRNDFLDLLIKVKTNRSMDDTSNTKAGHHTKDRLTLKDMTAQAFVFFAAGFETAASTTTFVLYELAQHEAIQQRVREEIDRVAEQHGDQVTYQALNEMSYTEQVVNETLRMHGSAPVLVRKCVEDYKIPDTNISLTRGIKVVVPSYAIHHDPEIYPEPFQFDPERFTEENIKSRHNYSFLPFGEGPRMCIGMRFGKMQVKAGLTTILRSYELSLAPDTPVPVQISPQSIVTAPMHPIKIIFKPRSG